METSFESFNNRFKKIITYYENEYGKDCKISLHHWKMLQGQLEESYLPRHLEEFKKLNEENKHLHFTEDLHTEIIIEKTNEIDNLLYCLKEMANYYLHEKELEDDELQRLQERVIDLLANKNAI
jgi:hypothetical protein